LPVRAGMTGLMNRRFGLATERAEDDDV